MRTFRTLPSVTTTITVTPNEGEEVQIIRTAEVEVRDGMLLLEVLNEAFTRGGDGKVRVHSEEYR